MNLRHLLTFFAGLGILLALLIINNWVFITWFDTTYLRWYLANGALIGLVSTIASLAWGDMNKHAGLISAHPFGYIGACLQLAGLPVYTMGTHLRSPQSQPETRSLFDLLLTIPFMLILVGIVIIWLVVIVPLQYFVYLICGAPARAFSHSQRQPIARLKGSQLEVKEISTNEKVPEGWWSASLSQKPVAITNLFVALFFLIVKSLMG
jgi:hypothetical protein